MKQKDRLFLWGAYAIFESEVHPNKGYMETVHWIIQNADYENIVTAPLSKIVKETKMSTGVVQSSIATLKEKGFLQHIKGRGRQPRVYRLSNPYIK